MTHRTKKATVTTAYGKELDNPITFVYEYDELDKGDAIPPKEQLDEDDIRQAVNAKRNANARSTAQAKALDAANIVKPDLKDTDFAIATMVKAMVAQGVPQDKALSIARKALGAE